MRRRRGRRRRWERDEQEESYTSLPWGCWYSSNTYMGINTIEAYSGHIHYCAFSGSSRAFSRQSCSQIFTPPVRAVPRGPIWSSHGKSRVSPQRFWYVYYKRPSWLVMTNRTEVRVVWLVLRERTTCHLTWAILSLWGLHKCNDIAVQWELRTTCAVTPCYNYGWAHR